MNDPDLPLWAALPASVLLLMGGLLAVLGAFGMLRLRDFYSRMHPPTMGATLGTGCVLLASMLVSSALLHRPVIHEVLITLFLVVTSPVTAILLMRVGMRRASARNGARTGATTPQQEQ